MTSKVEFDQNDHDQNDHEPMTHSTERVFSAHCMYESSFSLTKMSGEIDMARRFAFADGFLNRKLMTEKSDKKMSFCKISLLYSSYSKFLFS